MEELSEKENAPIPSVTTRFLGVLRSGAKSSFTFLAEVISSVSSGELLYFTMRVRAVRAGGRTEAA